MKRWLMFYTIHSMKNQGFSKRKVAEKLNIDFRTVKKYLAMTAEDYNEKVLKRERQRNLDLYSGIVTDWLKQYPDMTSAQVHDWLKEHYRVTVAERTVRRYVEGLRRRYGIPKAKTPARQYEAIQDPPMGQQMQVDIGMAWTLDSYSRNYIKLYCVASVLSHSRYKWGLWYAQPLNSREFVSALQTCFESIGGMPKELVFDQDRLLAVDENHGDIIYTKEFEQFRLTSGFEVYLCRGADPESKGRVEAVVKYFKRNFARNRQYVGIDIWNDDFNDWLERTGNGKEHGTTKKIPAEVFSQERLFLKPVPSTCKVYEDILTRDVHKNNTIFYEGNRYSVPLGTYSRGQQVTLEKDGYRLIIRDIFDGNVIAEHTLSKNKGELISNSNHKRDRTTKLDELQDEIIRRFEGAEDAEVFITQIRRLKPRHARDQFAIIEKTLDSHSKATIEKSLKYSVTHSLYSAIEFRNAAHYFESREEFEIEQNSRNTSIILVKTAAAISKKRELSEYKQAMKGVE